MWAFNANWDHPRILYFPRTTTTSRVRLWDTMGYCQTIPWLVPEKIFWEEIDEEGRSDRLKSISAITSPIYNFTYVTGITSTYKSGATRTVGRENGARGPEFLVPDDHRLGKLELIQDKVGILEIKVSKKPMRNNRVAINLITASRSSPSLPPVHHIPPIIRSQALEYP